MSNAITMQPMGEDSVDVMVGDALVATVYMLPECDAYKVECYGAFYSPDVPSGEAQQMATYSWAMDEDGDDWPNEKAAFDAALMTALMFAYTGRMVA